MNSSGRFSKLMRNGLTNLKRFYHVTYGKNLLATNIFIGGSCCFAGDILVQKLVEKNENIDFKRLAAMTTWGFLYGSSGHLWYLKMAQSRFFSAPNRQALLYLTCFCPIFDAGFYVYTGFFEGQTSRQVAKEVEEKLLPTLVVDACVYYPIVYCNVRFLPMHLRLSVDSFMGLFYAVFLSFLKHREIDIPMLRLNLNNDQTLVE